MMPGRTLLSLGEAYPAHPRVFKGCQIMKRYRCVAALLLAFLIVAAGPAWSQEVSKSQNQKSSKPKKINWRELEKALPEHYRKWLTHDVVYFISNDERQAFLLLPADPDRDNFIEKWWEIRNPTPGAPTNTFKEEVYRRIAYANQMFGGYGAPGWMTDRGRIYITLGAPKQKAPYYGFGQIRPMEIWFYDSGDPALGVPFFNVIFYREDNSSDFKLYSPFTDGPEKLIANTLITNDPVSAVKFIDKMAGREVARTSLSLIPSEPVDLDTAQPSIQSDLLINKILQLPNLPLSKEQIRRKRELLEAVSHRIILPGEYLGTLAVPLRDAAGNINLHYVLRVKHPEDFAVQQSERDRYFYNVEINARVLSADNKLIYAQNRKVSHYLDAGTLERVKGRLFGYEGWLPLAPGKYKVEFVLTNLIKHTGYRVEKDIVVPDLPATGARLTDPVPFSDAQQGNDPLAPFAIGGLKFTPEIGSELNLVAGQSLKFFYQLWTTPGAANGKKFAVDYTFGRLAASGESKTIHDDFTGEQFDGFGSLVNGKVIPLKDMPIGNYRLTMTLAEDGVAQKNFGSLSFRLTNTADASNQSWDIVDDAMADDIRKGAVDYQRGLCYLASGDTAHAIAFLRQAETKNPTDEMMRQRLVGLYYANKSYAEIAALYAHGGITEKTDPQTILQIAESLNQLGNTKRAIETLETAIQLRQESGPIYLTLASYYQRMGDQQKASDMERKGKSLMSNTRPTT